VKRVEPVSRRGLLGEKVGMTQAWGEDGRIVPLTVVAVGANVVTALRTPQADGYTAVQLAFGAIDPRRVTRPVSGQFRKADITPRRHIVEIRTADIGEYTVGQALGADVFAPGDFVDVTGVTKGKGFAGAMKRHGFGGLRATHGVDRKHRSPGSVGAGTTPGRVFRGTRMAGRMGNATQTTQNLRIHAIDVDRGLLLIRGAVPGAAGGLVIVRSASKRPAARTGAA